MDCDYWFKHTVQAPEEITDISSIVLGEVKLSLPTTVPRGLRHELSLLARTLGSWVRIPLKTWMFVRAFILCLCCPVCR
jgi:hypothetical protein